MLVFILICMHNVLKAESSHQIFTDKGNRVKRESRLPPE